MPAHDELLRQILANIKVLRGDLQQHQREDREDRLIVAEALRKHREDLLAGLEAQNQLRSDGLRNLDAKIDELRGVYLRAKGAGWVIIGLLGMIATIIGGAVLTVINGWIGKH